MEKKDILVVRIPNKFEYDGEAQTSIRESFHKYFESQFFTVVIFEENDTEKTQFEIIRC